MISDAPLIADEQVRVIVGILDAFNCFSRKEGLRHSEYSRETFAALLVSHYSYSSGKKGTYEWHNPWEGITFTATLNPDRSAVISGVVSRWGEVSSFATWEIDNANAIIAEALGAA
jgi:hypothetical protein